MRKGYVAPVVTWAPSQARPCACGGVVTADPEFPTAGVKYHRMTWRHQAWIKAGGPEAMT